MTDSLLFTISNDAQQVKVESWEQLIDWLRNEQRQWSWLMKDDPSHPASIGQTFQNLWNDMINGCVHQSNRGSKLAAARSNLTALAEGQVLYSESRDGRLVFDILQDVGEVEAASAAAFLTNHANPSHARTARSLRGMMLVALPDMQKAGRLEKPLAHSGLS